MTARFPWWVLALLFVALPVLEIYVLIQIGQVIGAWWTILLLVGDGFLGAWLMKHEGTRAWSSLGQALQQGRMPARELADGALVLVGGTLLLTPGFVTDLVGLFLVLPLTRPLARTALSRFWARRFLAGPGAPGYRSHGPHQDAGHQQTRPHDTRPGGDTVVRGEVVD